MDFTCIRNLNTANLLAQLRFHLQNSTHLYMFAPSAMRLMAVWNQDHAVPPVHTGVINTFWRHRNRVIIAWMCICCKWTILSSLHDVAPQLISLWFKTNHCDDFLYQFVLGSLVEFLCKTKNVPTKKNQINNKHSETCL